MVVLEETSAVQRWYANTFTLNESGYPVVSRDAFARFVGGVAHLFRNGSRILASVECLEGAADRNRLRPKRRDLAGSLLRQIVHSAAVCAPTDLWLLRQVLSAHAAVGTLPVIASGNHVYATALAEQFGLDPSQLECDLVLLRVRGLLREDGQGYRANGGFGKSVLRSFATGLGDCRANDVDAIARRLTASPAPGDSRVFEEHVAGLPKDLSPSWTPSARDIQIGAWLVPLVLAMDRTGMLRCFSAGAAISRCAPSLPRDLETVLFEAGMISYEGCITPLGARVAQRGPGPFGIVYSYRRMLEHHEERLRGRHDTTDGVIRAENLAASRRANTRSFQMVNDVLDRFCADTGFRYDVFVEHACGEAEAVRQRYARSGRHIKRYIAADMLAEPGRLLGAMQRDGQLPCHLEIVSSCDLGCPDRLIEVVRKPRTQHPNAVMVVGNGFHEIRCNEDDAITEVFRRYEEAGIVLLFVEETRLSDEQLVETAWNTYHAGFRYVHDLSGQSLRPAFDRDDGRGRRSWRRCVTDAGYKLLDDYTISTRRILPCEEASWNPPISASYLCVPRSVTRALS